MAPLPAPPGQGAVPRRPTGAAPDFGPQSSAVNRGDERGVDGYTSQRL